MQGRVYGGDAAILERRPWSICVSLEVNTPRPAPASVIAVEILLGSWHCRRRKAQGFPSNNPWLRGLAVRPSAATACRGDAVR